MSGSLSHVRNQRRLMIRFAAQHRTGRLRLRLTIGFCIIDFWGWRAGTSFNTGYHGSVGPRIGGVTGPLLPMLGGIRGAAHFSVASKRLLLHPHTTQLRPCAEPVACLSWHPLSRLNTQHLPLNRRLSSIKAHGDSVFKGSGASHCATASYDLASHSTRLYISVNEERGFHSTFRLRVP